MRNMEKIKIVSASLVFCLFTMSVEAHVVESGKITVVDSRAGSDNGDNNRSSMNMTTKVDIFDASGAECVSRSNRYPASGSDRLVVSYGGGKFEDVCTETSAKKIVVSWNFKGIGEETWTYKTNGNVYEDCNIRFNIYGPNDILSSAVGDCHTAH